MQSQVARRQQDFGANLKLSMPAPSISILLLILLSLKKPFYCQLLYGFPVLNLVLRCLHRMHAVQAINWHPQALTKRKVSRRHARRLSNSTVHDKLYHRYTLKPILAFICKSTYDLFNRSVLTLGLPIRLWMVSTTKQRTSTHYTPKCLPERRCETNVPIMSNILRHTKESDPIFEEQLGYFGCSELVFPRPAGY